jgi:hypothetical protein
MKVYIGIDDTDNLETRGTGFHARSLGSSLEKTGLLDLHSVTRHQLLVDKRIPFTSHNSSACLVGFSNKPIEAIIAFCRDFLLEVSAFDADSGLCVAAEPDIPEEVCDFGNLAKREVLTLDDAVQLAGRFNIYLAGFLNTKMGMIGSLAAIGLRKRGNDGRLLWMRNLRETIGIFPAGLYMKQTGVERIVDLDGGKVEEHVGVNITEWCRPVMSAGLITLFVEKMENNTTYEYQSASKEFIKSISE